MPGKVQESLKTKSMNVEGLTPVTLEGSDKGEFQLPPSILRGIWRGGFSSPNSWGGEERRVVL